MQILVVGMHRSGTSTVARLLNMLGVYAGAEGSMTAANAENPKGFWERKDVRSINDALLHSAGHEWDRILDFDVAKVPADVEEREAKNASQVVVGMDAHRPWMLKEPRFCFTLPFWRSRLELPVLVQVTRDPMQVAISLRTRNGIPLEVGLAIWEAHVRRQFHHGRDLPFVHVRHDRVLHSPWEATLQLFESLAAKGVRRIELPAQAEVEGFVDPSLLRSRETPTESARVVRPEIAALWTQIRENDFGALASGSLSEASRGLLRDYEPQSRKLQEALAKQRAAEQQMNKLAEMDSRIGQEGARYRQALSEISSGIRDLAIIAKDLGAAGAKSDALIRQQEQLLQAVRDTRISLESGAATAESRTADFATLQMELLRETRMLGNALGERFDAGLSQALEKPLAELERSHNALWDHLVTSKAAQGRREQAAREAGEEQLLEAASAEDAARAELRETFYEIERAASMFRSAISTRIASFFTFPLRLFRRQGDALDHIQRSAHVAHRRLSDRESVRSRTLEILRQLKSDPAPSIEVPTDLTTASGLVPSPTQSTLAAPPPRELNLSHIKVLVLAWDIGHNPVGRAFMLAEALSKRFDVVLAGPQFERYGNGVWPPIASSLLPIVPLPGGDFPEFFHALERVAGRIEADVVIACKPRLPSMELGFLLQESLKIPLILDIDDHELAFFGGAAALDHSELADQLEKEDVKLPFGETWTRHAESLIDCADAVLVSNPALQERFGGTLIPHARDFQRFNPAQVSRKDERARLGFGPSDRVVLFLGTIRPHKGVDRVIDSVLRIPDVAVKVCVIGDVPDPTYREKLESLAGDRVQIHPGQAFADLPRNVVVGDLVVLLQDPDSPISRYQLPAKVVDALAMGVPVLATPTPPLQPLIDAGWVQALGSGALEVQITSALYRADEMRMRLACQRSRIEREFSYEAIAERMQERIVDLLDTPASGSLTEQAHRLLQLHRQLWGTAPPPNLAAPGSGLDLVFFWKQNDSTLYGRRVDMLIKHFAARHEVRSITVFDAPTEVPTLRRWANADRMTHYHEVLVRTLAKRWGLADSGKVRYAAFVSAGKGRQSPLGRYPFPPSGAEIEFYCSSLRASGIEPGQAIVFAYPCLRNLPSILDSLSPRLVVCDLVDDHRTWKGQSSEAIEALELNYKEVLARSNVALANCEAVRQSMSEWFPDIRLLPNGCDLPDHTTVLERPHDLAAIDGPILGYVGNLEDKLDLELLETLALQRPNYNIVLIGSTHTNPALLEMGALSNVHFLGVRPYSEIPAYLAAFDVALIPHRDTDKTRAMNPLKLLVYLAHRVPVVSTRIDNLGELEQFCRVAVGTEAFIQAVDEATKAGRSELNEELSAALQANSWEARIDELLPMILSQLQES